MVTQRTLTPLREVRLQTHFTSLPDAFYQKTPATPLPEPRILSVNQALANDIGIDPNSLSKDTLANWLSGQQQPPDACSLAMKYTGHQFGHYNPDLGDGRGLLLGEWQAPNGILYDWHLKGAGQTAYSRSGDGRAVVRSCLREYLVGEALHYLGIPSTRALAVCASPQPVHREVLEPAATLLRITPSHIRFGHFEYAAYHQSEHLLTLCQYVIRRYYPDIEGQSYPITRLFERVAEKTAYLVAKWQAYGFLHGVLNTDNISIIGETFDHGPFAFIDHWQMNAVYNHTDQQGRYAFGQQPKVMHWNLACLANALSRLEEQPNLCEKDGFWHGLERYDEHFNHCLESNLRQRLGMVTPQKGDHTLLNRWLALLNDERLDGNALYRDISQAQMERCDDFLHSLTRWSHNKVLLLWLKDYHARVGQERIDSQARQHAMKKVNPAFLLRTHVAQEVIEQVYQGNTASLDQVLHALQTPFDDHALPKHWLRSPDQSQVTQLSCSS